MLKKITTYSGTVYLVDETNMLIKRTGKTYDGNRAKQEWQKYAGLIMPENGSMVILWPSDVPKWMTPSTITSTIVNIEEIERE